jgi:hypothetical protein
MYNFKNAKPSDRVWDFLKGWGTVVGNLINDEYPIEVKFDNEAHETFTLEGKSFLLDMNPTLFWDEVKIAIPQKPIKMKLVHGVEVPDISFVPEHFQEFFYPDVTKQDLFSSTTISKLQGYVQHSGIQDKMIKAGMCYPRTKEGRAAAILHAKAMLGVQ